jgi:polyisoprenoid-binding protein YceI
MIKALFILCVSLFIGCKENQSHEKKYSSDKQIVQVNYFKPTQEIIRLPINIKESVIEWKGTKLMKIGKHEGTVKFTSGEMLFSAGQFIGGHFVVDMKSIYNTDIPLSDPEPRKNLTRHLNEDFETDIFPLAYFNMSNVSVITATSFFITGDMNIKGIKKSLPITVKEIKQEKEYVSSLILDRFDWGIGKESSWLEKKLVDAEIFLNVRIVTL